MVVVLPAPLGPRKPEDLTRLDPKTHVVDRRERAVSLRDVLNLNHEVTPSSLYVLWGRPTYLLTTADRTTVGRRGQEDQLL